MQTLYQIIDTSILVVGIILYFFLLGTVLSGINRRKLKGKFLKVHHFLSVTTLILATLHALMALFIRFIYPMLI